MAEVRVPWDKLQEFTKQVFMGAGMSAQDAATEAEVLVWANLRGIDSHGVLRIPQYLDSVASGGMNPQANIRVEMETPAVMLVEADHAFGPVVTKWTMERVIDKARVVGIGWAVIRNTTHQGAMGYYARMAALQNMAGIAIVTNPPNMAPYGAKAAGVHNAPLAMAVPGKTHKPLVLDMATSVAAAGKISLAIDKGVPIPEGWALDRDGNPTTDPRNAAIMLPFGGYKASHMALMFECFTGIMAGNPLIEPSLLKTWQVRRGTQNSVVAAINIGLFTDVHSFQEHVDQTIVAIKGLPKADGFAEIFVPGEPEDKVAEERMAHGVPLPQGTADKLRQVAEKMNIPLPPGL